MKDTEKIDPKTLNKKRKWKNRIIFFFKGWANSLPLVALTWVLSASLGAFLFYTLEDEKTDVGVLRSIYWAVQVATTTGPGDITPKTNGGILLFIGYNIIVSVGLLLLLGANIIRYAIRDADKLTHREQEWDFNMQERNYAMLAWNTEANFRIMQKLEMEPMPLLEGQDPVTGAMPPPPPQPSDTDDESEEDVQVDDDVVAKTQ